MPYTLMKGLGWFLAALLLGMVIGWLLRSIAATRQMRKLRAVRGDHTELDRLRARNANLEPVVAERDRLVSELAASKSAATVPTTVAVAPIEDPSGEDPSDRAVAEAEIEAVVEADTPPRPESPEPESTEPESTEPESTEPESTEPESTEPESTELELNELNLVAAAAVIGKKVKLDDLTVIEGVGPAIAGLCSNIGIHTWADMAGTEVSLLRTMLSEAGSRFQPYDPTSWPEQAGLLATGQWEAYTALTASLGSGRASE